MTNYNDGKWHGWSGGECPVDVATVVSVVYPNGSAYKACTAGLAGWYGPMLFRVVTPYVEPAPKLECWVNVYEDGAVVLRKSKEDAELYRSKSRIRCVRMIEADGQGASTFFGISADKFTDDDLRRIAHRASNEIDRRMTQTDDN